jgi:hypothetical protein
MPTFAHVLDSVEKLSLDEQEEIAATVQRRVAEKRRAELVQAVKEARAEFAAGKAKPKSLSSIMRQIRE